VPCSALRAGSMKNANAILNHDDRVARGPRRKGARYGADRIPFDSGSHDHTNAAVL
jgi:hypothetical protein